MGTTRRVTGNENHDDEASIKTDDVGPWSYLNHDVLLLVMMQLGVIDFVAFSGVCKSWRSVALGNWKRFMASQTPMLMHICPLYNKDMECRLEDYERRKFKTTLTHSDGMDCIGLTCGYLILFRCKTKDFLLVNLITRHELNFPPVPCVTDYMTDITTCVLVFSPSISRLVFFILSNSRIWFSIAGEGTWNFVSTFDDFTFKSLHAFNGKIYIVNSIFGHISELTLNPEPKVTLLATKTKIPMEDSNLYYRQLVSWGENLYVMQGLSFRHLLKVFKLDFGKMEWAPFQDTGDEHGFAFFRSYKGHSAAVEPKSWADPLLQDGRFDVTDVSGRGSFFTWEQWYFPHECLNLKSLR